MAASWIIVAASLAVASSQSSSPWQTKHVNYIESLNANNPAFYQWVSPAQAAQQSLARQECPWCFAEPQTLEEAIAAEVNSKSQYAPGWKNANPQCPGPYCSYAQPQSFEDAIVVQAIPKSQDSLGWKNANVQCPGPHCPYVQPQSFEDAITVQDSPKDQYSSGLRKANPQCLGPYCAHGQHQSFQDAIFIQSSPKNFPAHQSSSFAVIPQGPQPLSPASPLATLAVLDDGTPVAVIPASAKSQVLVENPLRSSAKFITPQQSLAQPTTYLLENNVPITVVPAQAKTFQPAQPSVLAAIPQEASVKFTNLQQQSLAQPTTYLLENNIPITVVPAQVKSFQPAQPSVLAAIPQEASVKFTNLQQAAPTISQVPTPASIRAQLFGAPTTLVPLNHQYADQAPAQATVISTPAL